MTDRGMDYHDLLKKADQTEDYDPATADEIREVASRLRLGDRITIAELMGRISQISVNGQSTPNNLVQNSSQGSGAKPPWPDPKPVSELAKGGADVDWILHGMIAAGHSTLLSALMKLGKSTLLGFMLKALQDGSDFAGRRTKKCRTLVVSEESETVWAIRRDNIGLDDSLHVLSRPMLTKPNYAEWLNFVLWLDAKAKEQEAGLVIIDTLGKFAPWRDENASADVQATMNPLDRFTGSGMGLLLFHHDGRDDRSVAKGGRGSTALSGAVDILLKLGRYRDNDLVDRRRVLSGIGRFDEVPDEIVLNLAEDGSGYVAEGDKKALAARELHRAILDSLPVEPPGMTCDEVHAGLDDENRPRRGDVMKTLRNGSMGRDWKSGGSGKPRDPFRFWRCDLE
jgi:hypothetical protein